MEGVDLGAGAGDERDMRAPLGLGPCADPEERFAFGAEAGMRLAASFFRRELHDDGNTERPQRVLIECFRALHVGDGKPDVVYHGEAPGFAAEFPVNIRRRRAGKQSRSASARRHGVSTPASPSYRGPRKAAATPGMNYDAGPGS